MELEPEIHLEAIFIIIKQVTQTLKQYVIE